jgi:hypothetical protein
VVQPLRALEEIKPKPKKRKTARIECSVCEELTATSDSRACNECRVVICDDCVDQMDPSGPTVFFCDMIIPSRREQPCAVVFCKKCFYRHAPVLYLCPRCDDKATCSDCRHDCFQCFEGVCGHCWDYDKGMCRNCPAVAAKAKDVAEAIAQAQAAAASAAAP